MGILESCWSRYDGKLLSWYRLKNSRLLADFTIKTIKISIVGVEDL
jgi:hypothetical protein